MSTASGHTHTAGDYTARVTADSGAESHDGARRQASAKKGGLLRRGWRKITWVLIGWSTLIVVGSLITAGDASNKVASECQGTLGTSGICQEAASTTGAAQFEHLMKIGFVGFVVISLVWFMTRPQPQQ
jgi:hypothetical protein